MKTLRAIGVVLAIWGCIAVGLAAIGVAVVYAARLGWWGPLALAAAPWFCLAVMVARGMP